MNRHYFNCMEEAMKFIEKNGIKKYHFETPEEYNEGVDLIIEDKEDKNV